MLDAKTIIQGDSVAWLTWYDTDGAGTLADLSAGYTCRIVVGGTSIDRAVTILAPAYTGAAANTAFVAGLTPVETAALIAGQYVVSVKIAKASIGFSGEQLGILTIETGAPTLSVPTLVDQLTQNITELQDRRKDLALGDIVFNIWRDGRRLELKIPTIEELTALIRIYQGELVAAQVAAGITPIRRRHVISLAWA